MGANLSEFESIGNTDIEAEFGAAASRFESDILRGWR